MHMFTTCNQQSAEAQRKKAIKRSYICSSKMSYFVDCVDLGYVFVDFFSQVLGLLHHRNCNM